MYAILLSELINIMSTMKLKKRCVQIGDCKNKATEGDFPMYYCEAHFIPPCEHGTPKGAKCRYCK